MPSAFTDEIGTADLIITTPADWTITTGDMPNGDNSASLITALNQNAVADTEDLCLPSTAGSDARTLEFWINITNNTTSRVVAAVKTDDTSTAGASRHWTCVMNTTETMEFYWFNTGAGVYLSHGVASPGTGWHHYVVVINCGSTKNIQFWIDGTSSAAGGSPSGTPTTAASAAYKFFLGSSRINSAEDMTDHIAKVAWYDRALTEAEIDDHYLTMTAP